MSLSPRRTLRATALLATLAAGLTSTLTLSVGPAQAAKGDSADTWSVPAQAWVTIKGHGFGHGHGMSQYGALGAAREGLGYRDIIDFYYPGTEWATAKGRVTVLITSDTSDDLEVQARPGLTLRDTATPGRTELPDNGATRWRIKVGRKGGDRVAFHTDRWRRWTVLEGEGEFFAQGQPITLVTPSGTRSYRGRLRSAAPSAGSRARDTINELSLEQYLKGVVPLEMPALWNAEAVNAQAVAARSYATYERAHPRAAHHQICDTTSCQVYGGYDAEHPASNAAIKATRRQSLVADGKPAFTQFAASSGGWTSAGSVNYLPAIEDPYDDHAGNPVHDWSVKLSDTRIESAWPAVGNLQKLVVTRRDGNGDWGGRLASLTIVGSKGRVVVSGDTFRSVLGLRSTFLTFEVDPRK